MNQRTGLAFFILGLLICSGAAIAADATKIAALMTASKDRTQALSQADNETIDAYLNAAVDELLVARDVAEAVTVRNQILQYRGWDENLSLYTRAYLLTVRKHIKRGLGQVASWPGADAKLVAQRNLVILAGQLTSVELREFGLQFLGSPDTATRYWAVKSLTTPIVTAQIVSASDAELAKGIITALDKVTEKETHPEILRMIADCAGQMKVPDAVTTLRKVAARRFEAYEKWLARNEIQDAAILRALAQGIANAASPQEKTLLAQDFGQLYSYVIQRYILGRDRLDAASVARLESAILEVEDKVLPGFLGWTAGPFKEAVARQDNARLQSEHDALLGSAAKPGLLGAKFSVKYPTNPSGATSTGPKPLPPPAKKDETPKQP